MNPAMASGANRADYITPFPICQYIFDATHKKEKHLVYSEKTPSGSEKIFAPDSKGFARFEKTAGGACAKVLKLSAKMTYKPARACQKVLKVSPLPHPGYFIILWRACQGLFTAFAQVFCTFTQILPRKWRGFASRPRELADANLFILGGVIDKPKVALYNIHII